MNMPKIAIILGALLELVGLAGFAHSVSEGKTAVTALIPAFVGTLFILLGGLSLAVPDARKHAMHGLAMLALLGFVAAAGRFGMALAKDTGSAVARASLVAMAVLCLLTLVLCVKSFIDVRRARALTVA